MADASRDQNYVPTLLGVSNVDGVTPVKIYASPTTHRLLTDNAGGGSGTVTDVSVVTANGFAGTVATPTTTPAITLSTTITGILKGNGTAISAGVAGDVDSILPSQATNSGKFLTTNGTNSSWATVSAGGITIGTTTITSGTNTRILYDNSGVVGEYTITGTGTVVAMQTSPSLITPTLGVASATSINKVAFTAPATGSTLTIADGKTLTANSSLTLAGTDAKTLTVSNSGTLAGGDAFTLAIAASKTLTQSNSLTYQGTDGSTVNFGTGGTVLYTASTIPLTVGTTTIASGTTTRILYDNAGVLGEYTLTGSGTVVAMQTAPTFVTSITSPLVIGGSGTTGTQLTLQTTTGNGTTDALVIKGGNNGASTFATFTTGGALTLSTSGTLTTGTIELGAATDTTLSRASAGQVNIEGVQVVTVSNSVTLTNKTLTSPVITTSATTGVSTADIITPNAHTVTVTSNAGTASASFLVNNFTNSSAAGMTITLSTSSPTDGQFLEVRIYDFSAAAQSITWVNTENSTVTAPATSNGSTTLPLSVLFQWNSATSKWRCIASA